MLPSFEIYLLGEVQTGYLPHIVRTADTILMLNARQSVGIGYNRLNVMFQHNKSFCLREFQRLFGSTKRDTTLRQSVTEPLPIFIVEHRRLQIIDEFNKATSLHNGIFLLTNEV